MRWASVYYQEPLGMVASTAIPTLLKSTEVDTITENITCRHIATSGEYSDTQQALLAFVQSYAKPFISHRCLLRFAFEHYCGTR